MSSFTLGPHSSRLYELLSQSGHNLPAKVGSLSGARQVGDEDAALEYLNRSQDSLPPSVLWRAVFLDMGRVVEALLDAGLNPNPPHDPTVYFHPHCTWLAD
jgi:hypothetical protein